MFLSENPINCMIFKQPSNMIIPDGFTITGYLKLKMEKSN